MGFTYYLTPFELNDLKNKYLQEFGSNEGLLSNQELQEIYEDIHQRAFKRIVPAMLDEKHITLNGIKNKLAEFEWQALRKDYSKYECLGIENDIRIEGVARQVAKYLEGMGYEIEKDNPKGPEAFESSEFENQRLSIFRRTEELPKREIKKSNDEVTKVLVSFRDWLNQLIETRSAC